MSVEDFAREVTAVLGKLPVGILQEAGYALQAAHDSLACALRGTNDQEAEQAVGRLASAVGELGRGQQLIQIAGQGLASYLNKVSKGGAPPANGGQSVSASAKGRAGRLDAERHEALRAALPPPVPRPNPENRKTYGQWVDARGHVRRTVSGEDRQAAATWEKLREAGLPAGRKPVVTTHVEMKVAAEMIETGQRHTELVVNNRPCVGPLGCDSLLPVLLPEGYTVTVYGPGGYEETFEGGEQW